MAKKRKKKKPVIEQVKTEPELSETSVIEDEQATAPAKKETVIGEPPTVVRTDETMQIVKPDKPPRMPATMADIPVTPRPKVAKEPEYVEPAQPVICAGCKATVDSATVKSCLICPGSLVYCLTCAKPGSCHKCGKGLK